MREVIFAVSEPTICLFLTEDLVAIVEVDGLQFACSPTVMGPNVSVPSTVTKNISL